MNSFSSAVIRIGLAVFAVVVGWRTGQQMFQQSGVSAERGAHPRSALLEVRPSGTNDGTEQSVVRIPVPTPNARIFYTDRTALLKEGEALAARWPESAEEAHRRALELAAQDPVAGLTLLEPLRGHNFDNITTWQRQIMLDWAHRDQTGMFDTLEKELSAASASSDHWLSIAAAVSETENRQGLGEMLQWMQNAESSGSSNLTLAATSKLLAHLTPESADSVGDFLLQRSGEPAYRDALVQWANAYAHESPENALNRVQSVQDASLRHDALMSVVAAVTWDSPNTVAEWLNNGKFVGNSSSTDPESAKLRDEILTAFFGSLVSSHPDYVAQYSAAISDPSARQYLQTMADVMGRTAEVSPGEFWQSAPASSTTNGNPSQ